MHHRAGRSRGNATFLSLFLLFYFYFFFHWGPYVFFLLLFPPPFVSLRPEVLGSRIRLTDGGWHSTDGSGRLTDVGWPMTNRSYSPTGALRRFECTGGRQFFFFFQL